MTRKYRNHSADLKLKVALEAAKNVLTTNQIASKYGVYPAQVMEWKKRLLEEGPLLFQNKRREKPVEAYEDISYLQQQVGKLTTQIDWLKKSWELPLEVRKKWINRTDQLITLTDQLSLTGVSKAAFYYDPAPETAENLLYMSLIDHEYTAHPFYGSRKMTAVLNNRGYQVNRKRVIRLMRKMDLQAIYPKPNISKATQKDKKYPYLLNGIEISRPNQVWSSDIAYIPIREGFFYLVAVMDWFTRYVLAWRLSNTLDTLFCLEALKEAFELGKPEIFNTDQGSQYTSREFTYAVESQGVHISMDGKGRAFDNILCGEVMEDR